MSGKATNFGWALWILFLLTGSDTLRAQGYVVRVLPGHNAIANHFLQGSNTLDEVFSNVPAGATLYKWDPVRQGYAQPAVYDPASGWFIPEPFMERLRPGEGAFLYTDVQADLTFTGQAATPRVRRDVVPGFNLVSCMSATDCSFVEVFGFNPLPGDRVFLYAQPNSSLPGAGQSGALHHYGNAGWNTVPVFSRGRSAFVYLVGAPRILTQPSNQIVIAGSSASFAAEALGQGPMSYAWQFRGQPIPGATQQTFTVDNAQPENAGFYSVIVSNAEGTVSSGPAVLRIIVPPQILQSPTDMIAIDGQAVTLSVDAVGTAPLDFQWFFNGASIQGATNKAFNFVATPSDSGVYFVSVRNSGGNTTSPPARITVITPPTIIKHPQSLTVNLEDTFVLTVDAAGSEPLKYQWKLNGVNLPGADGPTLRVTNAGPATAGLYQVVVYNEGGLDESLPAQISLNIPILPMTDKFGQGQLLSSPRQLGKGSNADATLEPGELNHAGKHGERSMWLRWTPPADGIVKFSTLGSAFDTILAVYRGNSITNLVELAADDESGLFHSSEVAFVAQFGVIYHIVVDGAAGASGEFVLNWDFDPTPDRLPVILVHPEDQIAAPGGEATFTVIPNGAGYEFLWFRDGEALFGEINPTLQIRDVQEKDVAAYVVRVGISNRFVFSRRAFLQLNLEDDGGVTRFNVARDKFSEVFDRSAGRGQSGVFSGGVVAGYTGSQVFSTVGATKDIGEPNHCGVPGGASHWFTYTPPASGQLFLNTDGSSFNTVLAVYLSTGPTYAHLVQVACDNNHGTNGLTSSLNFPATGGTVYYLAVDGVGGASGTVRLNYRLLLPMIISNCFRTNSTTFNFRVTATPSYPFTVQRSTDMLNWISLLTTNTVSGFYNFKDLNAPATGLYYYRTRQIP